MRSQAQGEGAAAEKARAGRITLRYSVNLRRAIRLTGRSGSASSA